METGLAAADDDQFRSRSGPLVPIAIRYDGSQPAGGHGYQAHIGPRAVARGQGADRGGDPGLGGPGRENRAAPACTAAMGTGELAVTSPASLRVHGLDGLRVVDASVMSYITNGNIYVPVMMTAEKAADLILGNSPLRPSQRSSTAGRTREPARRKRRTVQIDKDKKAERGRHDHTERAGRGRRARPAPRGPGAGAGRFGSRPPA